MIICLLQLRKIVPSAPYSGTHLLQNFRIHILNAEKTHRVFVWPNKFDKIISNILNSKQKNLINKPY